ncbi:MAG: TetR/AcrR family transcriptional regulator [Bulleidia sp.]
MRNTHQDVSAADLRKDRSDSHHNDTCNRICQALLQELLHRDITEIKASQIAAEVGISRQTFYRYYDSVYTVLQSIQDCTIMELESSMEANTNFSFSDQYFVYPHPALIDSIHLIRKNEFRYKVLLRSNSTSFQKHINSLFDSLIFQRAIDEGYIRIDSDEKKLAYDYMAAGYNSIISYILEADHQIKDDKLAIVIYRLLFGSFRCSYRSL